MADDLCPIAVEAAEHFARYHPSWTSQQKRGHAFECYKSELRYAVNMAEGGDYQGAHDSLEKARTWLNRLEWVEVMG